jgi:hypothetical protein
MAPTITLHDSGAISVTWYSLDEAYYTGEVIKNAGRKRGKIVDSGFYQDGCLIQDLVTEARERGGK